MIQKDQYVVTLNCSIMFISFTYLGIPIRNKSRKTKMWEPLHRKLKEVNMLEK